MISHNQNRYNKSLLSSKTHGRAIHYHHYDHAPQEINAIATQIDDLIKKNIAPSSIAVLSRSNTINQRVVISLRARQIPTIGDNQLNSPHGRRLIALLYVLYKGFNTSHFASILYWSTLNKELLQAFISKPLKPEEIGPVLYKQYKKDPKHPISKLLAPLLRPIEKARKQLKKKKNRLSLVQILAPVFQSLGLSASEESPIYIARQQILSLAKQSKGSIIPLPNLIAQLELIRLGNPSKQEAVHTLTLHRSKGLGFDYVFIPSIQPGILPAGKRYLFENERLEEERRLLYVGMTRTQKQLILSRHHTQEEHGWEGFLAELPQNDVHPLYHSPTS